MKRLNAQFVKVRSRLTGNKNTMVFELLVPDVELTGQSHEQISIHHIKITHRSSN